jgi:hypothetical protein
MRTANRLALLALAAIAALAIAPAASAQTVEVHEEGGAHCGNVTVTDHVVSGGCTVHATTEDDSTANLYVHGMGGETEFSACENEFKAHINEDGLGFITDQVLVSQPMNPTPCGLEACDEAAPSHEQEEWPLLVWEGGPNIEDLATTFCTRSVLDDEGTGQAYCSVAVEMNQNASPDHSQEFTADEHSCVDSPVELSGHWETDATEGEIIVEHIH